MAATAATGGAAGLAVRGAGLTTRLAVAGAASGVGYQATEDAFRGELSSASTYLKSAGMGALGGVAARGAMGLKSSVGKASVGEGFQVLKASASQKIRQLPKMTQAVAMVPKGKLTGPIFIARLDHIFAASATPYFAWALMSMCIF